MSRDATAEVRAAGGVPWRRKAGAQPEVLVVHRPRYDDWSFPKGKLEEGETFAAAAHREVREETGYDVELGPELTTTRYRDRRGRPKVVRYWSMTVRAGGEFEPNHEVDERRWVGVAEAERLLTHDLDRQVLRDLMSLVVTTDR